MDLDQNIIQNIDAYFSEQMTMKKIPGASLGIVHKDKILYSRCFGTRDFEHNSVVTEQTLFNIGSVTKSFTAIAILQLVEQQKLSLADPVSKYLPLAIGSDIQVQHLLSHSSGLPNLGTMSFVISRSTKYHMSFIPMSTEADFWSHVNRAASQLIHQPGTRFFYSNAAFTMLGMIIELITGMEYHNYLGDNILHPLGILRGFFKRQDIDQDGDIATPYLVVDNNEPEKSNFPYNDLADAVGGLFLSLDDFMKYAKFYTDESFRQTVNILSPESFETLQSIQIQQECPEGIVRGYGFGLIKIKTGSFSIISHSGSNRVSGADLHIINNETAIVSLANSIVPPRSQPIIKQIYPDFQGDIFGSDQHQVSLSKFTGVYATYKQFNKISIDEVSGCIRINPIDQPVHPQGFKTLILIPDNENPNIFYRFHSRKFKERFEFIESEDGISLQIERYLYWKQ